MKKILVTLFLGAVLGASGQAAFAAVVQSFGYGSVVGLTPHVANFEANASLSNNYVENGLLLSWFGGTNNGGCGYEGVNCYDPGDAPGPAFSGNYMSANGNNAYVSIKRADAADFYGVEFAVGTNYLNFNGYWTSFNNTLQTGAGNMLMPAGGVLGLHDVLGFDEVRFFAFASANRSTGFSTAAIDGVRVAVVPEPAPIALMFAGLLGLVGLHRGRRQSQL